MEPAEWGKFLCTPFTQTAELHTFTPVHPTSEPEEHGHGSCNVPSQAHSVKLGGSGTVAQSRVQMPTFLKKQVVISEWNGGVNVEKKERGNSLEDKQNTTVQGAKGAPSLMQTQLKAHVCQKSLNLCPKYVRAVT
ncbi:hypothetical protein NDU88_001147 [Pleurodeles waltl]|uniref:Uncharacterized protein n=1 Tax=Pleurodeles waltl TaxID=8319 RepID=A0AAV7UT86_PLEWA|nr:hypothetical protein NDU88_001147 [Pleurodeles waltl]